MGSRDLVKRATKSTKCILATEKEENPSFSFRWSFQTETPAAASTFLQPWDSDAPRVKHHWRLFRATARHNSSILVWWCNGLIIYVWFATVFTCYLLTLITKMLRTDIFRQKNLVVLVYLGNHRNLFFFVCVLVFFWTLLSNVLAVLSNSACLRVPEWGCACSPSRVRRPAAGSRPVSGQWVLQQHSLVPPQLRLVSIH